MLDGAARCFARSGFHGTSMQDVLKEVGLSAGAVYRYFPGKEDIIAAITEETFATIRGAFAEAGRMARTMIATAQGFIVQEALFGDVHPEVLESGLRGLMSMGRQKAS
ncbi:helix-turn-helix domain-containing protein [Streptomyces sp. SID2119]|uniref:TetR family transcriptional regulator n=1 Tax=Streptomyces sp. SID2119 TaxID=2690253 RepID=UPI001370F64F|nr:TetR family transcriptional regulator [Streptomyces sp. SID2119]